jgi:hypothetical protein
MFVMGSSRNKMEERKQWAREEEKRTRYKEEEEGCEIKGEEEGVVRW